MKKQILIILLIFSLVSCATNFTRTDSFGRSVWIINIPNLENYLTLKCDFHMHTVYSDGRVQPAVRVEEAYLEGLDAISITDHIEYRPNLPFPGASHNSSYNLARTSVRANDVIIIRGSEITRDMPPGHFNAIFLADSDELDKPDYLDAFRAARTQNAFIFWNHPSWRRQQPEVTLWWPEHTQLLEMGMMHGIEVVNGNEYYPEAHQWCLERNLTMIGTSDIHGRMRAYGYGEHRTMTLVFARERTAESIYEALMERRTAVYFNEFIIGEERFLKELFEKSVEMRVTKSGNTAQVTFINSSGLVFRLKKDNHDPRLSYLNNQGPYTIRPQSTQSITVQLNDGIQGGDVNFTVENFLTSPNTGMKYTLKI